jgi:hypothetical protein
VVSILEYGITIAHYGFFRGDGVTIAHMAIWDGTGREEAETLLLVLFGWGRVVAVI